MDVAVIGAGITGFSTAALLRETGLSVAVFEALATKAGTVGARSSHAVQHLVLYRSVSPVSFDVKSHKS